MKTTDKDKLLENYARMSGSKTEIFHGDYKGTLKDIQMLNDGNCCGIYKFAGGTCIGGNVVQYSLIS